MGSAGESSTAAATRLKRENYNRTKHDSRFSKWHILIGPSDWEDHSLGKEGVSRYRVHNLPTTLSPGIYELGIAFGSGRIESDNVVVVYLGQADNVRTRLQSYGRSGSHLGSGDNKGCGLFEEVFFRGFSVAFRWTCMKDKSAAESTEAQLLDTFDYAWNKGSNGARRPSDILQKLNKIASRSTRFPNIAKNLQLLYQGKVGIKIEASKPYLLSNKDDDVKNFLSGIFKFSRSQPRLVSEKFTVNQDFIDPCCGFIMADGVTCKRPPVLGRKRCEEHEGKRIYGLSSKLQYVSDVYLQSPNHSVEYQNPACGINLGNGTFCIKQAVPRRKRCEEHKGMKINSSLSKPPADEKFHIPALSSIFGTYGADCGSEFQSSTTSSANDYVAAVCGATLVNGSFCRRQPGAGNKRCWQHKGRRADSSMSSISSSYSRNDTAICGVASRNGSVCMKVPVNGRKRCEMHKGMRVTS